MKPFLRWEYALAVVTQNQSAISAFLRNIENFACIKYSSFPINIDELRTEIGQLPHPDTVAASLIQDPAARAAALSASRGRAFLGAQDVEYVSDSILPAYALSQIPEADRPAVIEGLAQMGVTVEGV